MILKGPIEQGKLWSYSRFIDKDKTFSDIINKTNNKSEEEK